MIKTFLAKGGKIRTLLAGGVGLEHSSLGGGGIGTFLAKGVPS